MIAAPPFSIVSHPLAPPRVPRVIEFLQHFVNGLSVGTIYALIALGYTMVYGVLRLINFAHGDVYMLGAFAGYFLANALGLDASPSILGAIVVTLGAMVICAFIGVLIERFAYRPVRHHSRLMRSWKRQMLVFRSWSASPKGFLRSIW